MSIASTKARRRVPWIGTLALGLLALRASPRRRRANVGPDPEGRDEAGYRPDVRPFSFGAEGGQPAGYAVALCTLVADPVKTELGRPSSPSSGCRSRGTLGSGRYRTAR